MISTYSIKRIYDALFGGGVYLALHSGDPGAAGHNELRGEGYKRQKATFSTPSNGGEIVLSGQVAFTDMPAIRVSHYGVWDAASGGNFIIGSESEPKATNRGDVFVIDGGDITVGLGG